MTRLSSLLFTLVVLSAWGTFAPGVWLLCDRLCVHARLSPSSPPVRARPHGDVPLFLEAVARSVRAGESPVRAITAPAPCTRAVEPVQADLHAGATLRDALDRSAAEVVLLRSCLHHGVLSADSLEHASRAERLTRLSRADAAAAVATATHSARVLTLLPHGILVLAAVVSGNVRSALVSPPALVMLAVGIAANRAGSGWIARIMRDPGEPRARTAERACVMVAAHIHAGGSVESALSVASALHPAFGEVSRLLADGAPFAEALLPLDTVHPPLRTVLLAARRDGRPVSTDLSALADDIRAGSVARTRAHIARMPVRATLPLVTCVLPSFVLLAVAPVALAALGGSA
ncbi:MAG: type II secretion system F family protein [Acidimicrobiales bacterium]